MKTDRRFVLLATASMVAFLAPGTSARYAAATTPPTPSPPDTEATSPPAEETGAVTEIVQSWAVAPAGSLDPSEAGNRPELAYESDPGSVIEDSVTVFNYGNVPLTFRVYATDAFNNDEGQFDLLPGSEAPSDVGLWVTMSQELISIPPGQQATIPFTLTVPADAAPGDHAGAILASNEATSADASGQIVKLDRRTGTRLYLRVGGPLTPELAVTEVDTSYDHALNPLGGSAQVTFRIENRGNVRLGGTPSVTVAGPFGVGKEEVELPEIAELLPGQDVTLTADVSGVPALLIDRTTVRVEPTGSADATELAISTGTDITFAPPLTVLLGLLFVLLAVLARRRYRRHRAADLPASSEPSVEQLPEREKEHQPT